MTVNLNLAKQITQEALKFEKQNNIKKAIESYKKVLDVYIEECIDDKAFKLQIKIGDLYQITGKIESGLSYFLMAYESAKSLENKFFQIDSLAKISDSYLSIGKIEEGIKYADKAEDILSCVEYTKGRLEMSIFWARTYYVKKQFYKARDICNEALKLCNDDYPFLKGRILVTLAELYKDITSVEEHLSLLNQAYDYFEKVDYKRGMLGVINNIAAVYGDKLQDYETALSYFFKLKGISENSIFVEFHKISYLNIGEAYFKYFKYTDAVFWFTEALKNPAGAYMDNILVYNYSYLLLASLKLYNYQEAYYYFIKAKDEVGKNANVESTLIQYYKSAAQLFLEFGENDKSEEFIKQALNYVSKDETMIKWNIGLIYEYIKLKKASTESEIIDIVEGIKYTVSKYINKDEILDSVYDTAIELICIKKYELAFKLINEYNHIKSDNDCLLLKEKYIISKMNEFNSSENLEMLYSALELAKLTGNSMIYSYICCSIGDYFDKNNKLADAINYYYKAYCIVKKLIFSVPEEYRIGYINSNNSLDIINKFIFLKKKSNEMNDSNFFELKSVYSLKQLEEIFKISDSI
ncbi:tetratricopeptide repeat protein [Clostridiales bacterium oral taxon 876 str. F0540]|nr:tetratricopeptide repeat protein [Clostridiales bacterium oral taxon 876 str. F0540]